MNVLIYNGVGASTECVEHTLRTLSSVLEPFYVVNTISTKALLSEPWMTKTAALVFPGGADLPYVKECRPAFAEIQKFIKEKGGLFIGICAGAYLGSARCEFYLGDPDYEITGKRDLQFFSGTARGPAFPGFKDKSTVGGKMVTLAVDDGTTVKSYFNGGPAFISAENHENIEILAKYVEEDKMAIDVMHEHETSKNAATILCKIGKGKALLIGSHPEFVPDLMVRNREEPYDVDLVKNLKHEHRKTLGFVRYILGRCGLKVNDGTHINKRPLTPIYVSYDKKEKSRYEVFKENLKMYRNSEDTYHVKGSNDDFDIVQGYSNRKVNAFNDEYHDSSKPFKLMVIPRDEENIAPSCCTPKFDVTKYFENRTPTTNLGGILIYSEVIGSTSKLLDSNKTLTSLFPDESVVYLATHMNEGIGRGSNVWVSPEGAFATTTFTTVPMMSPTTETPISIIFSQYLCVLALIKTIKNYAPGYDRIPIKIKWPNDLYILNPKYYRASGNIDILNTGEIPIENENEPSYSKCGGALVNTGLKNGKYNLLIGTGCNLKNDAPSVSVQMWVDIINEELLNRGAPEAELLVDIEYEKFLALHLHYMSEFFESFIAGGSASFLPEYYSHWLHSSQIITLPDHDSVRAKITGITEDFGLLVARELVPGSDFLMTSNCYHLQPDGNTFDMFRGLISKKYM